MATNNSINVPKPIPVTPGGTGDSAVTAYAPLCGGVTNTDPLQSASGGQSNAAYVLTSNGNAALPTFQAFVPSNSGASLSNFKVTTTDNANINNISGNGVANAIVFPQILWNVGGNYAGGVFTATVAGYYYFYHDLIFLGIQNAQTFARIYYQRNSSLGQFNETQHFSIAAASFAGGADPRTNSSQGATVVRLVIGDTVQCVLQASGGAQTIDVAAGVVANVPSIVNGVWGGFLIS